MNSQNRESGGRLLQRLVPGRNSTFISPTIYIDQWPSEGRSIPFDPNLGCHHLSVFLGPPHSRLVSHFEIDVFDLFVVDKALAALREMEVMNFVVAVGYFELVLVLKGRDFAPRVIRQNRAGEDKQRGWGEHKDQCLGNWQHGSSSS
jgi:hypothetical protein